MKKYILYILTAVLALGLTACARSAQQVPETETTAAATTAAATEAVIETTVPMTVVSWYHGDDNAENLVAETAEIPELSPEALLALLAEKNILPQLSQVSMTQSGETLTLDLGEEFSAAVQGQGTAGEYIMLGSLVNTFLDNYKAEQLILTVNGQPLETGHNIYDYPLTR